MNLQSFGIPSAYFPREFLSSIIKPRKRAIEILWFLKRLCRFSEVFGSSRLLFLLYNMFKHKRAVYPRDFWIFLGFFVDKIDLVVILNFVETECDFAEFYWKRKILKENIIFYKKQRSFLDLFWKIRNSGTR